MVLPRIGDAVALAGDATRRQGATRSPRASL